MTEDQRCDIIQAAIDRGECTYVPKANYFRYRRETYAGNRTANTLDDLVARILNDQKNALYDAILTLEREAYQHGFRNGVKAGQRGPNDQRQVSDGKPHHEAHQRVRFLLYPEQQAFVSDEPPIAKL